MTYGIIYSAVNVANYKRYIGQTTRDIYTKRSQHLSDAAAGLGNSRKFHDALRKHGPGNFRWSVMARASSKEALDDAESRLIEAFDTVRTGYNEERPEERHEERPL